MSEHGGVDEGEERDFRYHRMALEAELREIEADGDPIMQRVDPDQIERENAMRASDMHFGLGPFTEVIPTFWREEILEPPDSPLK